jgi:hypothetical protein
MRISPQAVDGRIDAEPSTIPRAINATPASKYLGDVIQHRGTVHRFS